jgi:hypothetical protein
MEKFNRQSKYYESNKTIILEKQKEYYFDNREQKIQKSKEYYEANKIKIKEYKSNYRKKNKLKILDKNKQYYINNKEKLIIDSVNYKRKRREIDTNFKLKENISTLIRNSMRNKNFKKNSKTTNILGCTIQEFKLHLESKFESWMNWSNYGLYNGGMNHGWDIDHIKPLSSAKTEEEIIRLNHYTNLKPLCSYTNRYIKRDGI